MSNTYKDTPAWVKANRNLGTAEETIYHHHAIAGRPIYRYTMVRDENGDPITEEVKVHRTIGYRAYIAIVNPNGKFRYNEIRWADTYLEAAAFASREHIHPVHGYETVTQIKYQNLHIGNAPTECTGNHPLRKGESPWRVTPERLCSPEPFVRNWRIRPRPAEKRQYHSEARRQERNALQSIVKNYNTDPDNWDEDETELTSTRSHRHVGYWW